MNVYTIKAAFGLFFFPFFAAAQLPWQSCGEEFGPLPDGMRVYRYEGNYQNKPFRAFYAIIDLSQKTVRVLHDTAHNRRLTPTTFSERHNQPALVVNTSFFSFSTNKNLNIIVNQGKILAYNEHVVKGRGIDSTLYLHPWVGALGIRRNGRMDVAWTFTDRHKRRPYASQVVPELRKDSLLTVDIEWAKRSVEIAGYGKGSLVKKWKMKTAFGGGPVLVQQNQVAISNNQEWKFAGKAIEDTHPRTAIGYTKKGELIVLVIEGRNPGVAAGATLGQTATILRELGCVEALNLDGGGSSCMLINGKETIRPSDKEGQRAVPAAMVWERS